MKLIFVFIAVIAISFANKALEPKSDFTERNLKEYINQNLLKHPLKLPPELVQEFLTELNKADESAKGITAILNEFADKIFANLQNYIIHAGLDPSQLPEVTEGFNYTLLFVTWHGELVLDNGWLQGLSSLHRSGDVEVTYTTTNKYLLTTIPMTFDDLLFNYDYSATIMDLGPHGGIDGKMSDLQVTVQIGFDYENFHASLDKFEIVNSGKISFKFTGNILVDWLLNILTSLVITIMKRVILAIVESIIKGTLENLVEQINDMIDGILNPTTTLGPNVAKFLIQN